MATALPTQSSSIHEVETVLLLLLTLVIVFALLARKLKTPYPIVLVLGGLLLGFVPALPRVNLDPDVIFLILLPPLLYWAAWNTSWRDFRSNLTSICMLAFGLVGFTVLGVTLIAPRVFPLFDWRFAFVLGAVVATTDAIAATSVAKRIGLPGRIVDILEGESLLNDATGLLFLEFGIALLMNGHVPGLGAGFLRLLWLTVGGISVGALVGFLADRFERSVEYGPIEIILSLLIPYSAYLAAEAIHASGVLAVVTCGLYLSQRSAEFFSPKVRLQASAVWESINFILNGLAFILIGLQLPAVRAGISGLSISSLVIDGLLFSGLLIVLRLLWVFPGVFIANLVRRQVFRKQVEPPPLKGIFVVGWTGMRGVVALAAALSLPTTMGDASPFPQRNLILFLTFSVILVTLVLQGLTLPWVIRALGLAGAPDSDVEENKARKAMTFAAITHLDSERERNSQKVRPEIYDHLSIYYHQRLEAIENEITGTGGHKPALVQYREISLELANIERRTAIRLRNQGQINDEVLRKLQQELDLTLARLSLQGHE